MVGIGDDLASGDTTIPDSGVPEPDTESVDAPDDADASVETHPFTCAPCNSDSDCQDGTVCRQVAVGGVTTEELGSDGAQFCVVECQPTGGGCTGETQCAELLDGSWGCVEPGALCSCADAHLDKTGACEPTEAASCGGVFQCDNAGVPVCQPKPAGVESCNGIDDDCDGETDEDGASLCDDGVPCSTGSCVDGGCVFAVTDGMCQIESTCYESGDTQLGNPCRVCAPAADPKSWTTLQDTTPCEDGDPCTVDDVCKKAVCEAGMPADCDDDDVCTGDVCEAGVGCVFVGLDDTSCDDGSACTVGDVCQAGACVGAPKLCDDGLECTLDVCSSDGCSTTGVAPGSCLIDGACWNAGQSPVGSPCLACQPFVDSQVWTPLTDGLPCADGNQCVTDQFCEMGGCEGTPLECSDANDCTFDLCVPLAGCYNEPIVGLPCNDGDPCTGEGTCDGVECSGGAEVQCDDGDPCTDDQCDPGSGCVFIAVDETDCDDGDACTFEDECVDGQCDGTPIDCDDGQDCTLDLCNEGSCANPIDDGACLIDSECYAAEDAEPTNPCLWCDPEKAKDVFVPIPPGVACNDGNACTEGELCQGGSCVGGSPKVCNDENPCTNDSCDSATGCANTPNSASCSDGLFCTDNDICEGGTCTGSLRDCTGLDNTCTSGVCDEASSACVPEFLDGNGCDDGKACTPTDTCQGGSCIGQGGSGCCLVDIDCDDQNPCTVDACDTNGGVCSNEPGNEGVSCSDGQFCTENDTCITGNCDGAPRQCAGTECADGFCDEAESVCALEAIADDTPCTDDGNECTADRCAEGICVHAPTPTPCKDGNDCTFNDQCLAGLCEGTAYDCDDGLECTADVCLGDGSCSTAIGATWCVIGSVCHAEDDANPLNTCEVCVPQKAQKSWSQRPTGSACTDDDNQCTDDLCEDGACIHPPNLQPCDDGELCTKFDACSLGACEGIAFSCDDGVSCTLDACDGVGGCSATVNAGFCLIGTNCFADGMPDPQNGCATCDSELDQSGWTSRAAGSVCSDGSLCTEADKCTGGVCSGNNKSCDDGNLCTDDSCAPLQGCVNSNNTKGCSDGEFCTVNDACDAGVCQGGLTKDCSASGDQCNVGVCNDATDQCEPEAKSDGTGCNDGQTCTGNDACTGGACVGEAIAGCCESDTDCDDANVCTKDSCDVASGDCSNENKPMDGTSCEDGQFCTTGDKCGGGNCKGAARDCGLLDDECNEGVCDEGQDKCVKQADHEGSNCTDDGNVCTNDKCQGGVCTHPNNSADCDDGKVCSFNDACNGGLCTGTGYACDDLLTCTDDACDGKGDCDFTLKGGFCAIDGACYSNGQINPANSCEKCDSNNKGDDWTDVTNGTLCDDGDSCTLGDSCDGGACKSGTNVCGECDGKLDGEKCDDDDLDTIGDVCFNGSCAGFTLIQGHPEGANTSTELTDVTYTNGHFYGVGTEVAATTDEATKKGWVALVTASGGVVQEGSVLQKGSYDAITDRVAAGDAVAYLTAAGTWSVNNALSEALADSGLNSGRIAAVWGVQSNSELTYNLAGRGKAPWAVGCTGSSGKMSCVNQGGNAEFSLSYPRALHGFVDGSTYGVMASDVPSFGAWYTDAYIRTGFGTGTWNVSFLDGGTSNENSRDLFGTALNDIWVGGSHGYLRVRRPSLNGGASWQKINGVIGDQTYTDFNGVWANGSVVLYAGSKRKGKASTLLLVSHNKAAGVTEGWTATELLKLNDIGFCPEFGPCTLLQAAGINDVWAHGNDIVLVGWVRPVDAPQTTEALILYRQGLVGIDPIDIIPNGP